jgi:hypothetical protein
MLLSTYCRRSVIAAAALLIGGCSGASLPSLSEVAEAFSPYPVVGPPTDIYARIARGALHCWFGTAGPLKAKYVYHGEADPPAKGGKAEIVIHERDNSKETLRGAPAFHVVIVPDADASKVTVENLILSKPMGAAMEHDVRRWSAGEIECNSADKGWSLQPGEGAPTAAPAAKAPRT